MQRSTGSTTVPTELDHRTLFATQQDGFARWRETLRLRDHAPFSFFTGPMPADDAAYEALRHIAFHQDAAWPGKLVVSATRDLNTFFDCPVKWLYQRLFKTREYSLDAALLDDESLGILYHRILEAFFRSVQAEGDSAFHAELLDVYGPRIETLTAQVIREKPAFKGPLAVPLLNAQARGMARKLKALLAREADQFDGCRVVATEFPGWENAKNYAPTIDGDLCYKWTIDRVSAMPDTQGGGAVIFDYKTGKTPAQTKADDIPQRGLQDFQMPLYVLMWEREHERVAGAFFYSINDKQNPLKTVIGIPTEKSPDPRADYDIVVETAKAQIEDFQHRVSTLNMAPDEINYASCYRCAFLTACRAVYSLNPITVKRRSAAAAADDSADSAGGEN
jgi:hypothetical protein